MLSFCSFEEVKIGNCSAEAFKAALKCCFFVAGCLQGTVRASDRAVRMTACANLIHWTKRWDLADRSAYYWPPLVVGGVCSASITTAVSTAGRIIAEWSEQGGSQVSQLSARCQRKTHWSLKVMKRLPQRPSVLLGSLPALTLNRSNNGDDPCMPASHARIHILLLFCACMLDKYISTIRLLELRQISQKQFVCN